MKMLVVMPPRPHLREPRIVRARVTAHRLLDGRIHEDARNGAVLRCGADHFGMRMRPQLRIDIAPIFGHHNRGQVKFALLVRGFVVRRGREPDVDIEPDLMAGVSGEHRTTARLRHVADANTVPACLFGAVPEPFDEGNEAWMAPVAIARHPHDLPTRPVDRQLRRTGDTAVVVGADRPRRARAAAWSSGQTAPAPASRAHRDGRVAAMAPGGAFPGPALAPDLRRETGRRATKPERAAPVFGGARCQGRCCGLPSASSRSASRSRRLRILPFELRGCGSRLSVKVSGTL